MSTPPVLDLLYAWGEEWSLIFSGSSPSEGPPQSKESSVIGQGGKGLVEGAFRKRKRFAALKAPAFTVRCRENYQQR